jgi:8-oxo-dGTP pyrophosphatase MutT (NUDIX family)
MVWSPHVTVAAVIERAEHFLVVQEKDDHNLVYNQPAGHWEPRESLIDAVIRETREETGYGFQPQALVGIYHWQRSPTQPTFLRVCFTGILTTAVPASHLDPEILATYWLTREQLVETTTQLRSPMVLRCIDDYLAGARYPLDLLITLQAP